MPAWQAAGGGGGAAPAPAPADGGAGDAWQPPEGTPELASARGDLFAQQFDGSSGLASQLKLDPALFPPQPQPEMPKDPSLRLKPPTWPGPPSEDPRLKPWKPALDKMLNQTPSENLNEILMQPPTPGTGSR